MLYSRVALVIGVDEYDRNFISPLQNAVSDAQMLSMLLIMEGGFEEKDVLFCENPTQEDLATALEKFRLKVQRNKNCIAVLFYSGESTSIKPFPFAFLEVAETTLTSTQVSCQNAMSLPKCGYPDCWCA